MVNMINRVPFQSKPNYVRILLCPCKDGTFCDFVCAVWNVCELFVKSFCFVYVSDGCFNSEANASLCFVGGVLFDSFAMLPYRELDCVCDQLCQDLFRYLFCVYVFVYAIVEIIIYCYDLFCLQIPLPCQMNLWICMGN